MFQFKIKLSLAFNPERDEKGIREKSFYSDWESNASYGFKYFTSVRFLQRLTLIIFPFSPFGNRKIPYVIYRLYLILL